MAPTLDLTTGVCTRLDCNWEVLALLVSPRILPALSWRNLESYIWDHSLSLSPLLTLDNASIGIRWKNNPQTSAVTSSLAQKQRLLLAIFTVSCLNLQWSPGMGSFMTAVSYLTTTDFPTFSKLISWWWSTWPHWTLHCFHRAEMWISLPNKVVKSYAKIIHSRESYNFNKTYKTDVIKMIMKIFHSIGFSPLHTFDRVLIWIFQNRPSLKLL